MNAYTSIAFEVRDGARYIVLNRLESANALNATLSSALEDFYSRRGRVAAQRFRRQRATRVTALAR
jgi:enoyl-CoA hydratase/carnithine racemase